MNASLPYTDLQLPFLMKALFGPHTHPFLPCPSLLQAALNASLPYTDLQLPFLMKALYGHRTPKFVLMFRNPVDRIYSAFYG